MTCIRMVTEDVRQVAHGLGLGASELDGLPSDLKKLSGNISSTWQGGNAGHYEGEIHKLATSLDREIQNLLNLSSRVSNEVSEWENIDGNGSRWGVIQMSPFLPVTGMVVSTIPAALITKNIVTTPSISVSSTSLLKSWESGIDLEVSDTWTRKRGWKNNEVDLGMDAKFSLVDGAFLEGEDSSSWDLGGRDIGGVVGEYGISQGEAGFEFGVGEDGFTAGAYGEYDLATASGAAVLGSSMLGITVSGSASAISADGFVGYKEGTVGASIGASAASGDVGLGVNIAGINIGLEAGLSAGLELGIKLGADTEVKVGPFKVGLNFGKAITD